MQSILSSGSGKHSNRRFLPEAMAGNRNMPEDGRFLPVFNEETQ
jgi:hypothetical protein